MECTGKRNEAGILSMTPGDKQLVSATLRLPSIFLLIASVGITAAQTSAPKKDIPAIAKSADGAIVTVIAVANDKPIAQGTGFLVRADGVIMTNYHVIETGDTAVVKFPDDTAFPVDGILAADKARDLAIIKIHGKTFRTLTLGDSNDIQVGEEVVAIGNPLSLESTVSNGIISGVRSSKEQGWKLLQTTAPISPGSSGGPLFNMRGEVIGINALYLEGGENLNFAIPINDAKLLLSHQSTKVVSLPNEHKPAAPGGPPSTTEDAPVASTKETKGTYFVRSRKNETYFIEHRGHQLTAHCRESLSWLDGVDKLGRPLAGECVYMPSTVGNHISEDLMVRQDKELRYRPGAGIDLRPQVADVLDITDDVLLGAPSHPHPSPRNSPEIQKTLQWIQNTLADEEGKTLYLDKDSKDDTRINSLPDVNGCRVTFVYTTRSDWKEKSHTRHQVDLGSLDPTSLTRADAVSHDVIGPVSIVTVYTTNKVPTISMAAYDRRWEPVLVVSTTDLVWELPSPYAERFTKALHRAIVLCGGKASAF